jgi:hypothetical protein
MPAIVIAALQAWHHNDTLFDTSVVLLNQLLKFFDERCLLSVGNALSAFSSRTAQRDAALQCDRLWRGQRRAVNGHGTVIVVVCPSDIERKTPPLFAGKRLSRGLLLISQ